MDNLIDKALVRKVASLARLELSEQEVKEFTGQLCAILEYFHKINLLDTEGIEPLAHCLPITNRLREDQIQPGLDPGQALKNAPDRDGDLFKVPPILEEGLGP
ncbi:MAG: Asp-tRNA(Asn)/Glu-tRNA(Gln) amidotransferase subunit GatC [Sedimentisphaerales bacterium]|nr:Asp-tRNA(Asn)/Glu-tRNA(Gln) amidotransferase subunit GatC [Sedimentisphaerales bacterium]